MQYALLINEEFTLAAPCGTVAPLICQVSSHSSITLIAKPKLGDPREGAALDIIEEIIRRLQKSSVLFHVHTRNRRDGSPDRPDTVCIWPKSVPQWLEVCLPTSVGRYIAEQKRRPGATVRA